MNRTVSVPAHSPAKATQAASAHRHFCRVASSLAIVFAVSVAATAEPALRILKGANQQTTYAESFAAPLTVWVADSVTQQSLAGIRIYFTAGPGIGLSAASAMTDEHGLASVSAKGLAAGAFSVSAQIAGQPASQVSFEGLKVNKAVLTVVPADLASAAGDKVPAITDYTIQGFVNGDIEATAQITGSPVLTTTAKDNSPRANYAIKGGVGTLQSPNYTFVAGFGTLAVSGSANSIPAEETALNSDAEPASVRPALMNKPAAIALREPAFLAGLRGESGVFVQTAISATPAVLPTAALNFEVRNAALPTASAFSSSITAAPVRAAVSTKAAAPQASSAPVRTAVAFNAPAAAASAASPYVGSAIRKALILPGTK